MSGKTQKLSIRLLREGLGPKDTVREGVDLVEWPRLGGSLITLGFLGGKPPRWARFLGLSDEEERCVFNNAAYALIFIEATGRWFAITFGIGHVKLNPMAFEQDFGLRVVLNVVDPTQLKSADVRTPDENTLSRRSQTSRGADQTAFAIDVEHDIVRGLAGVPKDKAFASRVAGTDTLSMDRRLELKELPAVCAEALNIFHKTDYKAYFGWIDQIRHIRDRELIDKLDGTLVDALDKAVKGDAVVESLHLAFPVIYDPEKASLIRYKGFRSQQRHPDLDIMGYLEALRKRERSEYAISDLVKHFVHEVDDEGRDCGGSWRICECIVFETVLSGVTYVLSSGRWYQIDHDLANEVQAFFEKTPRIDLPEAMEDETEESYNARVAKLDADMICLDRKLIRPTGASSRIEACDFLGRRRHLIHVKDKTSSSRLSHLFSQGTVCARVLAVDPQSRDSVRAQVEAVQAETGQTGYEIVVPKSDEQFQRSDFTVVYAVIASGDKPRLPFFSLVSFRQAARELDALGYKYAFAWIQKAKTGRRA